MEFRQAYDQGIRVTKPVQTSKDLQKSLCTKINAPNVILTTCEGSSIGFDFLFKSLLAYCDLSIFAMSPEVILVST